MQGVARLFCLFCLVVLVASNCVPDPFGLAGPFNLYSLSNIDACDSDVEGAVAANGDVKLSSYSVGLKLLANVEYSLISSGAINWTSGSIWHGGITGASVTAANLGIMVGGETYTAECCSESSCSYCNSDATETSPLDFLQLESYVYQLSLFWTSLPTTTGATIDHSFSTLTLTCAAGESFNAFSGVSLVGVTSLVIACDASQTVLINYTPTTLSFSNLGASTPDQSKVIHHFTGATLTITGAGVPGSVVAPWSQVWLSGGIVYGNVIAGKYQPTDGTCNFGQINLVPFTGCCPIPHPTYLCCVYTSSVFGLENSFCSTEPECFPLPGWSVSQSNVVDCSSCCVCN